MNENDTSVKVSSLTLLLKSKLEATRRTKVIVSQSGNDTHDLLKKWFIPEDKKEVEHSKCTCVYPGIENDTNVQEIANGIGDVVNNAKTLRESFSARPYQSNPSSRPRPNSSATGLKSQIEKTLTNRPSIPRSNSMKSNMVGLGIKHSPSIPNSTSTANRVAAESNPSLSLSKRPLSVKSSTFSSTRQSTYQRDFAQRPPLKHSARPTSGKATSTAASKQSPQNTAQNVDKKPEAGKISIAQLEELLNRVSIDATLYSKPIDSSGEIPPTAKQTYYNENCSVHGTYVAVPLKQPGAPAMRQVGLAEAIDVVGVPADLVKVLQSYHRFLDKYHGDTQETLTEPQAANTFLRQLTKMNESDWSEAMNEPIASLFSDYIPLYNKASKLHASGKRSAKSLSNLRDNLDALEATFRKCSDYDSSCMPVLPTRGRAIVDTDVKKKTSTDQWAVAGIWNDASLCSFKGMQDVLCIRYNTVQQVQLFLQTLHEVQASQFQLQLLDVLTDDIVPQLHAMNPNSETFRQLFKVCYALCDVFNLKVPILLHKPRVASVQERQCKPVPSSRYASVASTCNNVLLPLDRMSSCKQQVLSEPWTQLQICQDWEMSKYKTTDDMKLNIISLLLLTLIHNQLLRTVNLKTIKSRLAV